MFAAKAGARLVYAVDACPSICDLAEKLVQCNDLQDRVRIINKRVEEIEKFDENIDIIISEWMGMILFILILNNHIQFLTLIDTSFNS